MREGGREERQREKMRQGQRKRGREEKGILMATDLGCSCNKRTLNNQ